MRHASILIAVLAACGSKSTSHSAAATSDAAPAAPAEKVAVAAPAPTFCDGKPCPCKGGGKPEPAFGKLGCELEAPLTVQGVPCAAGEVSFHDDGKLAECSLAAPVRVGAVRCEQNFALRANGGLERCYTKGHVKVGDFELEDKHWGGFDIRLYDDGSLQMGALAAPRVIAGKPCRDSVTLYRGGKPYECDTDAPITLGKMTLPAGWPVVFAPDGAVIGYYPQDDQPYDGGVHKAGEPVCLVKDCNQLPD